MLYLPINRGRPCINRRRLTKIFAVANRNFSDTHLHRRKLWISRRVVDILTSQGDMASTPKYEKCIDNIFVIEISFIISFWPSPMKFFMRNHIKQTFPTYNHHWQIFLLSSTFDHLRHLYASIINFWPSFFISFNA